MLQDSSLFATSKASFLSDFTDTATLTGSASRRLFPVANLCVSQALITFISACLF
jgi:hypothetical protein